MSIMGASLIISGRVPRMKAGAGILLGTGLGLGLFIHGGDYFVRNKKTLRNGSGYRFSSPRNRNSPDSMDVPMRQEWVSPVSYREGGVPLLPGPIQHPANKFCSEVIFQFFVKPGLL